MRCRPRGVACGLLTFRAQREIADVDDVQCRRHHLDDQDLDDQDLDDQDLDDQDLDHQDLDYQDLDDQDEPMPSM